MNFISHLIKNETSLESPKRAAPEEPRDLRTPCVSNQASCGGPREVCRRTGPQRGRVCATGSGGGDSILAIAVTPEKTIADNGAGPELRAYGQMES